MSLESEPHFQKYGSNTNIERRGVAAHNTLFVDSIQRRLHDELPKRCGVSLGVGVRCEPVTHATDHGWQSVRPSNWGWEGLAAGFEVANLYVFPGLPAEINHHQGQCDAEVENDVPVLGAIVDPSHEGGAGRGE